MLCKTFACTCLEVRECRDDVTGVRFETVVLLFEVCKVSRVGGTFKQVQIAGNE